ncbi:MAG: phospholipase D-like domain-containing protein, partial [Hydrogenophaga sp.]
TGSAGVAPRWTGQAQNPEHWRDTHVEVQGPVVGQMQSVFMDHWAQVTGRVLHGPDYFPALAPAGPVLAQMLGSSRGGGGGSNGVQLAMLMAMTAASRSIDLSAPHFSPDGLIQRTLLDALHRGVRVRVVVAGQHADPETGLSPSRASWGPLLRAGATIAEYRPTVYHCKMLIVDGLFTALGSATVDHRAYRRSDEATLNTLDRAFASAQTAAFEADLRLATAVSHAQWTARPWREQLREQMALLLGTPL